MYILYGTTQKSLEEHKSFNKSKSQYKVYQALYCDINFEVTGNFLYFLFIGLYIALYTY